MDFLRCVDRDGARVQLQWVDEADQPVVGGRDGDISCVVEFTCQADVFAGVSVDSAHGDITSDDLVGTGDGTGFCAFGPSETIAWGCMAGDAVDACGAHGAD